MKIQIPDNLNPVDAIRRCGYGMVNDRRAEQVSFSRRLGQGIYPRFHVYINDRVINLHLDQKQASYEGSSAHSGEYDSEVVLREGDRIKELLDKNSAEQLGSDMEEFEKGEEKEEKKGFWGWFK
ncbi:MAG: hypothetical protein WCV92_02180 [Candidatus Buchananbacteria bacterium]